METHIGFRLNEGEYAIPILEVREIINAPPLTRLPLAPDHVEGVTNLRGALIAVVDGKRLVGLPATETRAEQVVVVANGHGGYGILVDSITGVIAVDPSRLEPPDRLVGRRGDYVRGVAKLDGRLVTLLDLEKLLPGGKSLFPEAMAKKTLPDAGSEGGGKEVALETAPAGATPREFHDAKEYLAGRLEKADGGGRFLADLVAFLDAVGSRDFRAADAAIDSLLKSSTGGLYKEVGRVTRRLHDSLKAFNEALDPKIRAMASVEMPGAVDRLRFVIDRTEEAANRTMGIVERYLLSLDEFSARIREIREPQETAAWFRSFRDRLEDDLTEIITTQSFQDITGQAIRKVIELVEDVEKELVRLIAAFGLKEEAAPDAAPHPREIISQNDVDELLRGFGF